MNDWLNNPILKDVSPEKLKLLMDLVTQSQKLTPKELIPFFLSASSKAASQGIVFTDPETDLILSVLKERMNDEEKKKIDTIKKLSKMIASKKKSSS